MKTETIFDMPKYVHWSAFNGRWDAKNEKGEQRTFMSQLEAEKFAGIEYAGECEKADDEYWSKF